MTKIKENWQINRDLLEQAFLLQFEGNEINVSNKLGNLSIYGKNPVIDMKLTGLFGLVDALIDLGLTKKEIIDFYVQGLVEPYTSPHQFTEGIIEIVHGMPKEEIKSIYGNYFNDERIEKFTNISNNTKMLISFCYDKNDIYEFLPNKDDLNDKFNKNYKNRYNYWNDYKNAKNFQKIDGKLFRAIHFLVRQGYDFPELKYLTNEKIKDIIFKQTNGKNIFTLNKEYAREKSNNMLNFVYFLKKYKCNLLNPQSLFDLNCNNFTLINSSGKSIVLSRSDLELNINKYNVIKLLEQQKFEISDFSNFCDKRAKSIELKYIDNADIEHNMIVKREVLETISEELLEVIKKAYNQGFTFLDSNNLFNTNQKILKVIDPNGKEQLVIREQFDNMLDIIIKCKKLDFSINFNQLFDSSHNVVELLDKKGKKAFIKRNLIMHMMTIFSMLTQYDYSFNDYSNLFDENQPYIVVFDRNNQEKIISRKQINKIGKIKELSNKNNENLTESEKNLLSIINNNSISEKLFEWLPYTVKKWIPSAAVINKIPADKSYEYFYNNNHKRLKVLKDEYQPSNLEEMEGIVSIGYILGLFDSKELISEKALNYIIDYFLKKGVTADELHTTYGAIDLRKGYNKQFADFFMQHYAKDSQAFIEPDLGTNMTGELFERFDEVLNYRPEKKIKTRTRNKLLTPNDAMASITNVKIDKKILGEKADDERYVHLVELLMKFGASENEIKWAIGLYEQALLIDEQKVIIPNIEDLTTNLMKYTSYLKSNPRVFLSGRKTNCCSRYGGLAQDRLTHVITDPNWRYVTFTSPNRTFFDGLVWYDQEEKVVCIDNVEGQFSKIDECNTKSIPLMAESIIRYANGIYHQMNELNIPCIKVNVGKDPGTASWEIFTYAEQQNLICEDKNPCNYPRRNNISTDAQKQFTITDEKMLKLRRNIK